MKKLAKQRDYKREYELAKLRGERDNDKIIAAHVTEEVRDKFKQKAKENGTTPGTLIKEWILQYIAENEDWYFHLPKKYGTC